MVVLAGAGALAHSRSWQIAFLQRQSQQVDAKLCCAAQ
jgi:hypothetical protein